MFTYRSASILAATAALAALAPAAGAGASSSGCAPTGAKVLRSSSVARVYELDNTLYGCTAAYRTKLGQLAGMPLRPATRIARYLLAGRYVAFDTVDMGVDTFSSTVTLIDLENGVRADHAATPPARRPESFSTVVAMIVDNVGIAAWIGRESAIGQPTPTYDVYALTATSVTNATEGTTLPTDLRLNGHTLSWHFGKRAMSQTIPTSPVHTRLSAQTAPPTPEAPSTHD